MMISNILCEVKNISLLSHPLFELFLKLAISKLLVLCLCHFMGKYIHCSFYSEFGSFSMETENTEHDVQNKQLDPSKRKRVIDLVIISRTNISEELIFNQNHGEATTTNARYGECSICLMDFKCKDRISRPKSCRHEFHFNCLHKWLEMKDTCPCCRQNVFQDLESESEQVVNREPNETILRVSL
jgi:hypothetical protein